MGDVHHLATQLRPEHDLIMDYHMMNPQLSVGELAAHFEVHVTSMSRLINRPDYKAEYRRRRELLNEKLAERMTARLFTLHNKASNKIQEELDSPECAPTYALEVMKVTGTQIRTKTGIDVQEEIPVGAVDPEELERARATMRKIKEVTGERIFDNEATEDASDTR